MKKAEAKVWKAWIGNGSSFHLPSTAVDAAWSNHQAMKIDSWCAPDAHDTNAWHLYYELMAHVIEKGDL